MVGLIMYHEYLYARLFLTFLDLFLRRFHTLQGTRKAFVSSISFLYSMSSVEKHTFLKDHE